jgi:uncharacterized protein (TIGR02598 family)
VTFCSTRCSIRARPPPGADRTARARAFSLVEVVMAIAIASSSLLVIFLLLPSGLSGLNDATRQLVETEIFSKMNSELNATPFYSDAGRTTDLLASYQSSRFPVYFDYEGNEVPAAEAASRAIFTVRCVLAEPSSSIWSPAGSTGTGELRWATVRIGFHQDPGQADSETVIARKRTFLVVNKGS